MRTSAPALIPLFRSDGQARLLAVLFDAGRSALSIGDLARAAKVPVPTVSREVMRLSEHNLVHVETVGRTRLVSANWSLPWARTLADLLAQTVGLPSVVARALESVAGVEEAYIFGSWAAREAGESGPPPQDIDLLVVGDASLDDLREPLTPAEELAGLYINPTPIPRAQWESDDDPFVQTVKGRPMVPVPLPASRE